MSEKRRHAAEALTFGAWASKYFAEAVHRAESFWRELLIPFGRSGYVVLFEVEDAVTVKVLAVRHQLEDDCH